MSRCLRALLALFVVNLSATFAFAQDKTNEAAEAGGWSVGVIWVISIGGAIAALYFAWTFFKWMVKQPEGDEKMVKIAENVRQGAAAYLNRQYKIVFIFFFVVFILLGYMSWGLNLQGGFTPFAFLTGGIFSALAGYYGMKTATLASSRTTQGATNSLNNALQVAFRSGAVMGLVVVGFGLLDICNWFLLLNWIVPATGTTLSLQEITVTMMCAGMGASSQALFARVGGGIFTKAADVGADLVGKVEAGIPEDDPRNPATIADNVGDNVGDVAGMGADLYESYIGSILASAALGVAAFSGVPKMQMMAVLLPMIIAGLGILLSVGGIFLVKTEENATQKGLMKALDRGQNVARAGVIGAAFLLVWVMLVNPSESLSGMLDDRNLPAGWSLLGVFWAIVTGLLAGWAIGKWTEYSTSEEFKPTRRIADQASTGPATVIIAGMAEGLYSVWVPIVCVGVAILASFGFCTGWDFQSPEKFALGLYGVAIAAVGMLSTLAITLATDAYGPIADNAGGNAEMSGQEPIVRERTDQLDSLGNTTAATGKGFAIGSAALTALALLAAYVEQVRVAYDRWSGAQEVVAVTEDDSKATLIKIRESVFGLRDSSLGDSDINNRTLLVYPLGNFKPTDGSDLRKLINAENGAVVKDINLKAMITDARAVYNDRATMPDYVRFYNVTVMNPKVLIGMFLGVMLAFVFCAMTMKAVGRAAGAMVEEVRRQFREIPGIMEGKAEPEYASCVAISTASAQKEMIVPSSLGLVVPIVIGFLLGVPGVMGLLAGALTSGFAVAIMMANAGGAWDNAKKYIESGAHGGKGTEAHKATVVGDTVGDPFKDTSGPSLNILIKLISIVSVVFAGFVVQYALNF